MVVYLEYVQFDPPPLNPDIYHGAPLTLNLAVWILSPWPGSNYMCMLSFVADCRSHLVGLLYHFGWSNIQDPLWIEVHMHMQVDTVGPHNQLCALSSYFM